MAGKLIAGLTAPTHGLMLSFMHSKIAVFNHNVEA